MDEWNEVGGAPENFEMHEYGVIYLDILGQKELMEELEQKKASSEEELQMQVVLRYIKKLLKNLKGVRHPSIGVQQFSDTTVIYIQLDGENSLVAEFLFVDLICALPNVIFEALKEGVLLRGAVAKGMAWEIKQNCLYGPVIRDASDLEGKVAQWPRVIVSNAVISLFKEHLPKRKKIIRDESDKSIQLQESIFVRGLDGIPQIALFPKAVLEVVAEKDEDRGRPQRTLEKFFVLGSRISKEIECRLNKLANDEVKLKDMNEYSKLLIRHKIFLQEVMTGIRLFAQYCEEKDSMTKEEYEGVINRIKNESKNEMSFSMPLCSIFEEEH